MTKRIRHILLVPAEGDPHGLLRGGPCGARPPIARCWQCRHHAKHPRHSRAWAPMHYSRGSTEPDPSRCARCGEALHPWNVFALVLAWEGEAVVEGLDRLDWCRNTGRNMIPGRLQMYSHTPAIPGCPDPADGIWWAWEKGWAWANLENRGSRLVVVYYDEDHT